jgi:meiotically up-regulated gene 157 (Mug157) protein
MIKEATRGHLSWVYRAARRPLGYWHRSYLANGVPKDGPVFQFDQQCYPLLEICDFLDTFPKEREFVRELIEEDTIPEVLKTLNAHRDARTGLYMTDETPGDDAVEYPFHFSSHILLWYTLSRLSHTLKGLGRSSNLNSHTLEQMASMIKDATFRHFVCNGKFAYLTDGQSNHTFYHDANDIPTLFARDWGFVESASELSIWANTMDFGLSPENKEGFFPEGRFQGLGSVHTRAPWPLGYAQELIYAELRGDAVARESAWTRIKGTMFWDGLFAEAVDGRAGRCVSKAWFSWPGSVIGSAILNKDRRAKLDVLSVKDRR